MLKKVILHNVATYTEPVEVTLSEVNYFFGSNGSGKSTFANVISKPYLYEHCKLFWAGDKLKTFVYNKNFVKENFEQDKIIKGIFTLGKGSVDLNKNIQDANEQIDKINKVLIGLEKTLIEKDAAFEETKKKAADNCWEVKNKYNHFEKAYVGFNNSKEKFLNKCIVQKTNANISNADLEVKYKKLFNSVLIHRDQIKKFDYEYIRVLENNNILSKVIVGKKDLRIGDLINKLNNSYWVAEGLKFLKDSEGFCPMCQQELNRNIEGILEEFFDETYNKEVDQLKKFREEYESYIDNKINELRAIVKYKDILDLSQLTIKVHVLKDLLRDNLDMIDKKIKYPNEVVILTPLEEILSEISSIINLFIQKIEENNAFVDNIKLEESKLIEEVWSFIGGETKAFTKNYLENSDGLTKAKKSIQQKIDTFEMTKSQLYSNISIWESLLSDTKHTINQINKLLSLFSFTSFKLIEAKEKGFYKIVRNDGGEINETLSEGEYTFISFLYFFHLIKGNSQASGITDSRIVVFDDPISSLDSGILFVVSSLIKEIINMCRNNIGGIKQVIVLTHNVYFHKEVTFKGSRIEKYKEETFFLVNKIENISSIKFCDNNPVQTTYQLLWKEISNIREVNKVTIFNTMRRILEYYFNIIGGMKYEDCINKFEGEDLLICRSLVSWINDGSHFIADDLVVDFGVEEVEKYLRVFRNIFDLMGHRSHYDMMVNNCLTDSSLPLEIS